MTITPFPSSPNLENLKKRAKALLKSVKAGDQDALDLVGPYFGDPHTISLQQAHLVIARSYGFSSWDKLKMHIEGMHPTDKSSDQLANQFLELVTVIYENTPDMGPKRFARAHSLLEEQRDIRNENIYTAAAIGDVTQIDYWLDKDPSLINRKGGYFNWEPLMYASYARLPNSSTLDAGKRLLERGADPSAYYMWGGQCKFTALTGVFGCGENGPVKQPEHPDCVTFARMLLEHGANPNDSQAAYNRCFLPDNSCLELLLEFGLTATDKNNWLVTEDDHLLPSPSETMHFHLIQAIRRGYIARAKLLIDHGVDINKQDDTYETRTKGKTPYQTAMLSGETQIAAMLVAAGAKVDVMSEEESFQIACMEGALKQAQEMLEKNSNLVAHMRQRDMLCDAVLLGNSSALKTMIDLGFDVNDGPSNTALHQAAFKGDITLVQLLLDAGADPTIRDCEHFSTPFGFAQYANNEDIVELLQTVEMDIFTAAALGDINRLERLLSENPLLLEKRFSEIRRGDSLCQGDWLTPLANAALSNHVEAVQMLLGRGANPNISDGDGNSLHDLVLENAAEEIASLIAKRQ